LSEACYRSVDFTGYPGFLLSIKLIPHDKAEIFLIMVLNTIAIHHPKYFA
jgi:hypothetical protein